MQNPPDICHTDTLNFELCTLNFRPAVLGKPEPLKHELSGYWSRRIDSEHRLVYAVTDAEIIIVACRYHYKRAK
ncbi:MAG: Txe/YoeB family addiction module toxin [Spirulina sp. SIO3F2]|nr:Txe/YoeB family addiction module toxin [Spirulina sp. SIO3F2]